VGQDQGLDVMTHGLRVAPRGADPVAQVLLRVTRGRCGQDASKLGLGHAETAFDVRQGHPPAQCVNLHLAAQHSRVERPLAPDSNTVQGRQHSSDEHQHRGHSAPRSARSSCHGLAPDRNMVRDPWRQRAWAEFGRYVMPRMLGSNQRPAIDEQQCPKARRGVQ
jgi:hypothetical protein